MQDELREVDVGGMVDFLLRQEEAWARNPSRVRGIPTGYPSLDELIGGFRKGEMVVIGARTSHGKTALTVPMFFGIADHLRERVEAGDHPGRVVMFNPEMRPEQLFLRYVSARTRVPLRRVEWGELESEERESWRLSVESMGRFDGYVSIFAGKSIEIDDLLGAVYDTKRRARIELVLVDYLNRIVGNGSTPYQQATDISRKLKDLANDLDVPVVVLSQTSRPQTKKLRTGTDDKQEAPPTMHELRDSGNLEQDADTVMMLYNPPDPLSYRPDRPSTLFVEKQRNGPVGKIALRYYPQATLFEDMGRIDADGG